MYLYCASWGLFRLEKHKPPKNNRKQQRSRTVKKQKSKEKQKSKRQKSRTAEKQGKEETQRNRKQRSRETEIPKK